MIELYKKMRRQLNEQITKKEKLIKRENIRPFMERNLSANKSMRRKSSVNAFSKGTVRLKSSGSKKRPGTRA